MQKFTRVIAYVLISFAVLTLNLFILEKYYVSAGAIDYSKYPVMTVLGENNLVEMKKNSGGEWVKTIAVNQMLQKGDLIRTNETSEAFIVFPSNAIARLNANAEIQIEAEGSDYYPKLLNGEVWGNAEASSSKFQIEFGDWKIESFDSIFDIAAEKEKATLKSIKKGTKAVFKDAGFFVDAGNQIFFDSSAKEPPAHLKYSAIPSDWIDSEFAKMNAKKDEYSRDIIAQALKIKIQNQGFNYTLEDFSVNEFLLAVRSFITFSGKKADDSYLAFISNLIDDGVYYLLVDNKQSADESFVFAFNAVKDSEKINLNSLKNLLIEKFNQFKVFSFKDGNVYLGRDKIRDLILAGPSQNLLTAEERIYFIRSFLYDALGANTSREANALLSMYFDNLFKFNKYIAEDNKIVYDAIIDRPEFYKKNYLELKSDLEKAVLLSISDETEKIAEEENMILEKLNLLKNTKDFALNNRLSVRDAAEVSGFIKNDIDRHIASFNETDKKFFESELGKFSDFIAFLKDDKYLSSVYGGTTSERFISYLNAKRERRQVEELKKSILGPTISKLPQDGTKNIDEIEKSIAEKLEQYGIKVEEFGELEDGKYVLIKKGIYKDMNFSAKYDFDFDIISEISVDGENIVSFGIKLEKITAVFDIAEKSTNGHTAPPIPMEEAFGGGGSELEGTAKVLVAKKLKEFGLNAVSNQIAILNLSNKEFRVSNIEIDDKGQKIFVNLDFKDPFKEAVNVEVKTVKGFVPLEKDKTILLQDLSSKAIEFYDKIFYEQLDKEIEEAKKK